MDDSTLPDLVNEAGSGTADRPRSRSEEAGSHRGERAKGHRRKPKGSKRDKSAKPKSGRGSHRRILKRVPWYIELPLLVVIAVTVAFVLKTFVVQAFFIPSGSMENTLAVGDRVLVDKVTYRFNDIQRGDIVVFDADGVLAPENADVAVPANPIIRSMRGALGAIGLAPGAETDYIKRVIGVAGDRVVCCDAKGRMSVNGVPLDEGSYLYPGNPPSNMPFDVTVPAGSLWVMGDHRSASADSRSRINSPGGGFIPVDRVVGRAMMVTWPLSHFGLLHPPDTLKQPAIDQQKGQG